MREPQVLLKILCNSHETIEFQSADAARRRSAREIDNAVTVAAA